MNGQLNLFEKHKEPQNDAGSFSYPESLAEHLHTTGLSRGRVKLAAELAALEPDLSLGERRALFAVTVLGLEAQAQGSTFVPLFDDEDTLRRRLEALIPEELAQEAPRWAPECLADDITTLLQRGDLDLVGREGDWKPLIVSGEHRLYHQRMMLYETRLVEAVASRLSRSMIDVDDRDVKAALGDVRTHQPPGRGGAPMELSSEQEYALLAALHRPLTLITGGPGTGKTSIVVSVLRMMVRLGVAPGSLALAAPTGKAANRMAESIYGQLRSLDDAPPSDRLLLQSLETPKTLHRLMGYSPRRDRFAHHAGNPLPHRMVIVDEASMIDLFLMERLFAAVSPTAQLVLLGDADQLPSVDTGAVLRDLVPEVTSTDAVWRQWVHGDLEERAGDAPTSDAVVRLEKSYRMRADNPAGREILTFARSIRDYDDEFAAPRSVESLSGVTGEFQGVRLWQPDDDDGGVDEFAQWWFTNIILASTPDQWVERFNAVYECDERGRLIESAESKVRRLLDHFGRAQVLTLTRVFSTGSVELNRRFHQKMARFGRGGSRGNFRFYPGEPVMMLRNDYERDLFNGDQGVVVWCRPEGQPSETPTPTAVFDRSEGMVSHSIGELGDDLEHAFAMTVHKAQGSEFERLAMVLPQEPMALLNRELLYTGLTRASQGVLVAGSRRLLEYGAAHRTERFSAVGEKLKDVLGRSR